MLTEQQAGSLTFPSCDTEGRFTVLRISISVCSVYHREVTNLNICHVLPAVTVVTPEGNPIVPLFGGGNLPKVALEVHW